MIDPKRIKILNKSELPGSEIVINGIELSSENYLKCVEEVQDRIYDIYIELTNQAKMDIEEHITTPDISLDPQTAIIRMFEIKIDINMWDTIIQIYRKELGI